MPSQVLLDLLARNRSHADALAATHFDDVRDGQDPPVVTVCCSDSRVSQEGMWDVTEPGWLFTPSNIGNQARDRVDGEFVVDGNLLYPVVHTGTRTIVVVGHTGCGAVTAAYETVTGPDDDQPPGIDKWVEQLVPVVEAGLSSDAVEETGSGEHVINQLVEYNVREQVAFLTDADEIPADSTVYGFVYDLHEVYGDEAGRAYLVDVDGETDPVVLNRTVPEGYEGAVESLLA